MTRLAIAALALLAASPAVAQMRCVTLGNVTRCEDATTGPEIRCVTLGTVTRCE